MDILENIGGKNQLKSSVILVPTALLCFVI